MYLTYPAAIHAGRIRMASRADRDAGTSGNNNVRDDERVFMEIVGIVRGVMGVYDSITNPSTGDLQDQINDGFHRVEQQLSAIQQSIDQVINVVIDQGIRGQYVTTERVITESLRCYNAYSSMTDEQDAAYWRGEFLRWGAYLRESVSFLLDGMLGRGIIAGDVFLSIVASEQVIDRKSVV